ncbi:MAG: FIST N-terminal domain-containing protein, partial [Phycisphaeraceae bacterium]|nr:FIST N-terminal domain-containing protein [Phycisphaeraceae bacterium]
AESVLGAGRELEEGPGLSVLAAQMPDTWIRPLSPPQLAAISRHGRPDQPPEADVPRPSLPGNPRAIVLMIDPFSVSASRLLTGLKRTWPEVPVAGAMASAGQEPGDNRLWLGGRVFDRGAVAVAIGGEVDVRCVVSQGCKPIGQPWVITRSKRHVVQELGGQPALEAVRTTLSSLDAAERERVDGRGLLVGRVINEYQDRFGRGDFLIRGVVGVDREAGYLAIGDPRVAVGQTIQFHVRDAQTAAEDFDLLLDGEAMHGTAAGALLINCNGRGRRLFDQPDADVSRIGRALGNPPLAGCFAAGEIGPVGDQSYVHGHSASLVVFRAPGAGSQTSVTDV